MSTGGLIGPAPFNPFGTVYAQTHGPDDVAIAKARVVLRDKLSDAQRRCFDKHGFFFTLSPSGKRYKIGAHFVRYIEDGEHETGLCVYPKESMPVYDQMLAIKLHIETNEDKFLETANKFPV